jgi:predicted nucleic acid-binding protein
MVLVDTSVWVDFFNGVATPEVEALDGLIGSGAILIGDLILAEILQGFARDADYRRARAVLLELPYTDLAGREVAIAAADHYRSLRAKGVTVRKTVDMIIGTYCLLGGHVLLHSDRDFDVMEKHLGMRVFRESRSD